MEFQELLQWRITIGLGVIFVDDQNEHMISLFIETNTLMSMHT